MLIPSNTAVSVGDMTDEAVRIGARIAAWRERRHLTQAELARRAFLTRSYIAHLETGRNKPSLDALSDIAAALGVPRAALLNDEPPRETADERTARMLEEAITGARGVPVRVRWIAPAGGGRTIGVEAEERYVRVLEDDLTGARDPFAILILSDCYLRFGLIPDDYAICERHHDRKPQDGDIVVIASQDGVTLRRWHATDDGVQLIDGSGNVARHLTNMDDIDIEGYYITVRRKRRS